MIENKKILVIDDDINLCQSLRIGLEREGASVITANDGRAGVRQAYEHHPDLILLDIRMPEMNGWETCRQIRNLSNVPIIMLTSLNKDQDIVRALEYGADDFVSKPFSRDVLVARARAVLRRTHTAKPEAHDDVYADGYLTVDRTRRQVLIDGEPVKLSSTEYKLLTHLMDSMGQTLTYKSILTNVWGWEYKDSVDYVHVYMSHLRRKIEPNSRKPIYLLTDHGVGYSFCKNLSTTGIHA